MGLKEKIFSAFDRRVEKENKRASDSRFSKLAYTLSKYFSAEPEKERVLRHEDFDKVGDTYYATVAAWYKVLQRVFLLCLVVFSTVSVAVNFKYITYDNFFYLVKDFGTAVDTENIGYETLSYDASSNQSFALYRGGLAVVGRTNVSSFTATGRRTLNARDTYSSPFVTTSDKYMLVYDMGDGNLAIYNAFSKVYSEKLDYPITDADFSDEGSFAILTRSEKFLSEIAVYDGDFEPVVYFRRGDYATDISFSASGEYLGAVYVSTENGVVCSKLVFYDVNKKEKINEFSYVGEFPLACTFLESGTFAFISDGAVRVFDKTFEEKYVSDSFSSMSVSAACVSDSYAAVAFNDGSATDKNKILVFDKKGNLVYNDTVDSEIFQLAVKEEHIFIKNGDGVLRVAVKKTNSSPKQLSCTDGRMLVYNGSTALVCSQAKAVYLKFD